MENRRYTEGGSIPPRIQYPISGGTATEQDALRINRRTQWIQPVPDSALSGTDDARACFVERKNSQSLQRFMLNYAYSIVTTRVLSGEV